MGVWCAVPDAGLDWMLRKHRVGSFACLFVLSKCFHLVREAYCVFILFVARMSVSGQEKRIRLGFAHDILEPVVEGPDGQIA